MHINLTNSNLWEQSSIDYQPNFTQTFDHDLSLLISKSIQAAYEKDVPLSIVYIDNATQKQFCGYVEQIDPYERWIALRNGLLKRRILFTQILYLDCL